MIEAPNSVAWISLNFSPTRRQRCARVSTSGTCGRHKSNTSVSRKRSKSGQCYLCSEALTTFDQAKPCQHWLLKPEGFGKEHFERLANQHSWLILENYLRWVANEGAFAKNINDLENEGTGKLVELTINYKNLEWSFSCSASDLSGHEGGGEHSKRPHYHFQLRVDCKPFIKYNDFHLPLSAADVGLLEYMSQQYASKRGRLALIRALDAMSHENSRRLRHPQKGGWGVRTPARAQRQEEARDKIVFPADPLR